MLLKPDSPSQLAVLSILTEEGTDVTENIIIDCTSLWIIPSGYPRGQVTIARQGSYKGYYRRLTVEINMVQGKI